MCAQSGALLTLLCLGPSISLTSRFPLTFPLHQFLVLFISFHFCRPLAFVNRCGEVADAWAEPLGTLSLSWV